MAGHPLGTAVDDTHALPALAALAVWTQVDVRLVDEAVPM